MYFLYRCNLDFPAFDDFTGGICSLLKEKFHCLSVSPSIAVHFQKLKMESFYRENVNKSIFISFVKQTHVSIQCDFFALCHFIIRRQTWPNLVKCCMNRYKHSLRKHFFKLHPFFWLQEANICRTNLCPVIVTFVQIVLTELLLCNTKLKYLDYQHSNPTVFLCRKTIKSAEKNTTQSHR